MEKLSMCRICLVKKVRMYVVVNKNLHELYEKLTDVPFVTEDSRPMLACFICCTKLKQCWRFVQKCLEAEKLFAQIMNEDNERDPKLNLKYLEFFNGFINSPIVHTSIGGGQTDSVVFKEELPAVSDSLDYIIDLEEVHQTGKLELDNVDNSYPDVEDTSALHSESDSEDVPLLEIKTKVEDVSIGEPVPMKPKLYTRFPKPGDTISAKHTKNESNRKLSFAPKIIEKSQNHTSKQTTKFKESFTKTEHGVNTSIEDDIKCNKILKKSVDSEKDIEKRFECDVLLCSCSVKSNLIRNILTHTDEKLFKCDICQRRFSQKSNLIDHTSVHTGEKPFKCDTCQSSFSQKHDLTDHIRSHTGEKPQSSVYQRNQLASHIRGHTGEKPFKCDVCQRSFSCKSRLNCHIRVHTGEKPFKCHICPRSFTQKHNLTNHIRTHTDENPFKCDICHRSFHVKYHLKQHIRTHTGEKPYKCDICQSRFYLKQHLTNHIRIHTGERPFKCDICHSRFKRKGALTYHTRGHNIEKPIKCDICQRSFNHKSNLTRHIRTHTVKETSHAG